MPQTPPPAAGPRIPSLARARGVHVDYPVRRGLHGGRWLIPITRLVLPVIGILFAAIVGDPAHRAFDLLVGAQPGF